jgi:hypothetical protein
MVIAVARGAIARHLALPRIRVAGAALDARVPLMRERQGP